MTPSIRLLLLGMLLTAPAITAGEPGLAAHVDRRIELMSLIFRLAGNPEYNQPNSMSPYAREVESHFGTFRDHAVVQTARQLRARRGVSYDAVMSLAVHLEDAVSLGEKIPLDLPPPRLDSRWQPDEARDFLAKARAFVDQTGFTAFADAHRPLYETAAERMTEQLSRRRYLAWFDTYFGARPGARFTVIVGLLNGGCCYGVGVRYPDGREEITPVIGAWTFDAEGQPVFDDGITGTVVHELCHSYTNPLVERHAEALRPAGERIFAGCREVMARQAYGTWQTLMYESLVRATVVRYLETTDGADAGRRAIREEESRGFKWIGQLAQCLTEYESQRTRYETFDAFMPRVVEFFQTYAQESERAKAQVPAVAEMVPANGAGDVDPGLREIKITFDRPMRDRCWSVVGGGPHFPELTGSVHYDLECRVLTIPARLKPGWSYEFWLNRGQYDAFQSREGVKLEPVRVTFSTRAE